MAYRKQPLMDEKVVLSLEAGLPSKQNRGKGVRWGSSIAGRTHLCRPPRGQSGSRADGGRNRLPKQRTLLSVFERR